MPHYVDPCHKTAYVIICYRNFAANNPAHCHVGLGVNAVHTAKCLRKEGIHVDVIPIWDEKDLAKVVLRNPTHIVVEAPFISQANLLPILNANPDISFVCRCHSQIGFLQVEAGAIKLMRDYLRLQGQSLNFDVSINHPHMGTWLQQVYGTRTLLLPNLYFLDRVNHRHWNAPQKLIKVDSFGAVRIQKNHSTAAAAALMMSHQHKRDLEFYVNVNREEHGKGVLQALKNMFANVPHAELVEIPWTTWSDFRHEIANMDIHLQMSMSETFNLTTADAVAEGVPAVVSEAIDWAPKRWITHIDDVDAIARKMWDVLNDPNAPQEGLAHLKQHNEQSLAKWIKWLRKEHDTMPEYFLS